MVRFRTITLGVAAFSSIVFAQVPLANKKFEEIIKKYVFVGDFSIKPETVQNNQEEVFWRYPITIQDPVFELPFVFPKASSELANLELPATPGSGRAIQHLNRGRTLFLEGKYAEARSTWLTARSKYGKDYEFHRRCDYFIALAFLNIAHTANDARQKKLAHNNAATFLSWAFEEKRHLADPVLENLTPQALYSLGAIYYNYGRYAAAYGIASEGLNYLRKTGRTEYRSQLRRILAESYVKNRDYLEAVSELDVALRQDTDIKEASSIFARVGDIYFDLNNFPLAEDAYELALGIDNQIDRIQPVQFVLRGESLFWMGKYEEAIKMLTYALDRENHKNSLGLLNNDFLAVATIRIADAWLAQASYEKIKAAKKKLALAEASKDLTKNHQKEYLKVKSEYEKTVLPLEKAKLQYFRHIDEFPSHPTAAYSKIRLACLELPEYEGKNVAHARKVLDDIKTNKGEKDASTIVPEAMHLAWACHVASFAQRERTKEMVQRVKEFYTLYPHSKFLADLIGPVKEVQASAIEEYFKSGDIHSAVSFFEKTRPSLFEHVDPELQRKLFIAYVDLYLPKKAEEFWGDIDPKEDAFSLLRRATVASELFESEKTDKWRARSEEVSKSLMKTDLTSITKETPLMLYINRIMNTRAAIHHKPWIMKIAESWATKDTTIMCQVSFPLLSKAWSNKTAGFDREKIKEETIKMMDEHLKDIFAYKKNCGYSLLEFELLVLSDQPTLLKERLLARTFLPLDDTVVNIYWAIGEKLKNAKDDKGAREIWQFLVKNGPKDLPQVRYSKLRLESKKSEFERLWD
ncbi:MAG: tetratricopeptide repeat protein [Oligoflexales bacterium]